MHISDQLVEHIAELSKLKLDKNSREKMKTELEAVVGYMDVLNSLDTTGVEPLSHIANITNVLREDEICPSCAREDILQNAKESTEQYFTVPKTVE